MKYTEQILFIPSCFLVFWQAYGLDYDSYSNYKKGLCAVIFIIFIESLLKGEIIFFKRYNAFWRAALRVAMLYLCALVFLAFQNEVDARQLLRHIYPELGQQIKKDMHTYDDHCDLTWENFLGDFDHYYAIHWFNWFCLTLIVRDRWIMHGWHVYCELLECSWKHILPHFAECWWDQVFTDVLLANIPAVEIGLILLKKLGWKQYDWLGITGKSRIRDWDCFNNHRRFCGLIQIVVACTVNFLCGFFLINALWIPPQNSFNIFRLIVWFLTSNMSFRELYTDIDTWGTVERIRHPVSGKARWITLFLCITEVFCSIKFLKDSGNVNLDAITPIYIWLPWAFIMVNMAVFYLYLRFKVGDSQRKYPSDYYVYRDNNMNKKQAESLVIQKYLEEQDKIYAEAQNGNQEDKKQQKKQQASKKNN